MKFQYQGAEILRQQRCITEGTNNSTQYYCHNTAKLLALVRHTNEHERNRSTNLWVWPEKLGPLHIVTAAAGFNHTHF